MPYIALLAPGHSVLRHISASMKAMSSPPVAVVAKVLKGRLVTITPVSLGEAIVVLTNELALPA